MNIVDPVCELLRGRPASLDEGFKNFSENPLTRFVVLQEGSFIGEISSYHSDHDILS
jgi:hypothetical protein